MSISSLLSSILHPSAAASTADPTQTPTSATQVGQTDATGAPTDPSAAGSGTAGDGSVGLFDGVLKKAMIGGAVGGALGFIPFIPGGPILGGILGAVAGAAIGMYHNFKQIKAIQAQNVGFVQQLGVQPTSTAEAQDMVQGDDTAVGAAFVGQLATGQLPTGAAATQGSGASADATAVPTQATATTMPAQAVTGSGDDGTQMPVDASAATDTDSTDATATPVTSVTGSGQPDGSTSTATQTGTGATSDAGPALVTSPTDDGATDPQLQSILDQAAVPVTLTTNPYSSGSSTAPASVSGSGTDVDAATDTDSTDAATGSGNGGDLTAADPATLAETEQVARIHAQVAALQADMRADEKQLAGASAAQRAQLRKHIAADHRQIAGLRSQAASAAQALSDPTAATDPTSDAVAGAQAAQTGAPTSTASLAVPDLGPSVLPDGTLPAASAAQTG